MMMPADRLLKTVMLRTVDDQTNSRRWIDYILVWCNEDINGRERIKKGCKL